MHDLKFAFRQLLKHPAFSLVVVASLAVGIGANAVVFTWIRATLLNAIPMAAAPGQLSVLQPEHKTGGLSDTMSLLDIESLAAERKVRYTCNPGVFMIGDMCALAGQFSDHFPAEVLLKSLF